MEYKGYTLLVAVKAEESWTLGVDANGNLCAKEKEWNQTPNLNDPTNILGYFFKEESAENIYPELLKDVEGVKQAIDMHIVGKGKHHGWDRCTSNPDDEVLPSETNDCSMCGAKLVGENTAE